MITKHKLKEEVIELTIVTLYFFVWFLIFIFLKDLLLIEYSVKIQVFGSALLSALIVGKVVLLLGKTSFGNLFYKKILLLHILWRSLSYTLIVFIVTLAERIFNRYSEAGELSKTFTILWEQRDIHHFLAMNICVLLSFIFFNTFSAINSNMGDGQLKKLFLSRIK